MQSHELFFSQKDAQQVENDQFVSTQNSIYLTVLKRRGTGMAKSFSKEKLRQVPQKERVLYEKSCVTFLLCDTGRYVHKPDIENKWEDCTHTTHNRAIRPRTAVNVKISTSPQWGIKNWLLSFVAKTSDETLQRKCSLSVSIAPLESHPPNVRHSFKSCWVCMYLWSHT